MNNLTTEHFDKLETFINEICHHDKPLFTEKPNLSPFQKERITRTEFDTKIIHEAICVLIGDASRYEHTVKRNKELAESNSQFQKRLTDLKSELDRIKLVASRMDNLKSYKQEKLK